MNEQQKIQMWMAFAVVFPYLQMTQQGTIEYEDVCLFKFTLDLFYNHVFYGPLNVSLGSRSPFYSVTCVERGFFSQLYFENDIGPTCYVTTDELKEQTARFWEGTEASAAHIGKLAGSQVRACIKDGDLRGVFRHLRMLAGAKVWTHPRLRAALVRAIPTRDEQEHNRYLKRRRELFAYSLKRFKIAQIRKNWADLKEVCKLTWQMSALGRIVRGMT